VEQGRQTCNFCGLACCHYEWRVMVPREDSPSDQKVHHTCYFIIFKRISSTFDEKLFKRWDLKDYLTPQGQGNFSVKNHSKLLVLLRSFKRKEKYIFLESNRRILYFTSLKSCGKNFMKFNGTNWKIITFKVGKICFF